MKNRHLLFGFKPQQIFYYFVTVFACSLTHSVEISEVLVHFCVAQDGVTFTHSPQHALEGFDLHPLDEAWHKPVEQQRSDQIKFKFKGHIVMIMALYTFPHNCSSPQLGSESLHTGASCHRVCLHSGELFILGTKSLMLIIKRNMFHSRQLLVWFYSKSK